MTSWENENRERWMLGRKVLPAFSIMIIREKKKKQAMEERERNQPEHESPGLISILGEVA